MLKKSTSYVITMTFQLHSKVFYGRSCLFYQPAQ